MTSSNFCALTKTCGKFVKSHIFPLALTRLERTGEKFVETGIGLGIKRRSNSLYDSALVNRVGEDILADIDSKGIDILRRHKLVWSGWNGEEYLNSDDQVFFEEKPHHRLIHIHDTQALQLFFLSLIWRAAASSRPEFNDFKLNHDELENLKLRILNKNPGDFKEYPIQLFQLYTLGIHHNRTPLMEQKEIIDVDGPTQRTTDYARLYFDGLIIHINLPRGKDMSQTYQQTCLGTPGPTIVFLHRFEDSRTNENIIEMINTVHKEQFIPSSPLSPIFTAITSAWK